MELKVWVEGIQRIVCGVNEKTTCQVSMSFFLHLLPTVLLNAGLAVFSIYCN